jgi:hypothetical protein
MASLDVGLWRYKACPEVVSLVVARLVFLLPKQTAFKGIKIRMSNPVLGGRKAA